MKMKRFIAPDIRRAIRMVRDELGEDAVILSNRNVDGKTEIVAAIDFDEEVIREKTAQPTASPVSDRPDTLRDGSGNPVYTNPGIHSRENPGSSTVVAGTSVPVLADTGNEMARSLQTDNDGPSTPVDRESGSDHAISEVRNELKELRMMLDQQQFNASNRDSVEVPIQKELLTRLGQAGFSDSVCRRILTGIDTESEINDAWNQVKLQLADQVLVVEDSLVDTGGTIVFVGPTGVGKTTTIAKLAARYRLKHGSSDIALITADNYRIAAHEQLNTYGRILDIPVRGVHDAAELKRILNLFADKRLVLIDTAGMSQRDMRLADQFKLFRDTGRTIDSYLVMSAATQYGSLQEIVNAFSVFQPRAGILTKFDEAVTCGAVVSTMIENRLPLAFVTNGQKVPEHLHEPTARAIVKHCLAVRSRFPDAQQQPPSGYTKVAPACA